MYNETVAVEGSMIRKLTPASLDAELQDYSDGPTFYAMNAWCRIKRSEEEIDLCRDEAHSCLTSLRLEVNLLKDKIESLILEDPIRAALLIHHRLNLIKTMEHWEMMFTSRDIIRVGTI